MLIAMTGMMTMTICLNDTETGLRQQVQDDPSIDFVDRQLERVTPIVERTIQQLDLRWQFGKGASDMLLGSIKNIAVSCIFVATQVVAQPTLQTVADGIENHDGTRATIITANDALQGSVGQVIFHVGDGFSPTALRSAVGQLINAGVPVSVQFGGPEGLIQPYMYGNMFPPDPYSARDTPEMNFIIIRVARDQGLID